MIKISQQSLLRISTITIKNFRSFYGEREPIELSVEAEHPVTIFHGTSGRGKTTLLNAIHWCIYNREGKIKQKKTSSEGLVHSCTIESLRQGEEDDMSVEILIENENHMIEYEIKREIKIKKSIKHEVLYRKDYKYDIFLSIKYNYKKTIKGLGSAIFLHLTKNYQPTAGCIAVKKKDFLILLKLINSKSKIKIN